MQTALSPNAHFVWATHTLQCNDCEMPSSARTTIFGLDKPRSSLHCHVIGFFVHPAAFRAISCHSSWVKGVWGVPPGEPAPAVQRVQRLWRGGLPVLLPGRPGARHPVACCGHHHPSHLARHPSCCLRQGAPQNMAEHTCRSALCANIAFRLQLMATRASA